jgi:hypothetical protein
MATAGESSTLTIGFGLGCSVMNSAIGGPTCNSNSVAGVRLIIAPTAMDSFSSRLVYSSSWYSGYSIRT